MGHIRLGRPPRSRKRRKVVALRKSDVPLGRIVEVAAKASEYDLSRASSAPRFQVVANLPVMMPPQARSPGFSAYLESPGLSSNDLASKTDLLSGPSRVIDANANGIAHSSAVRLPLTYYR